MTTRSGMETRVRLTFVIVLEVRRIRPLRIKYKTRLEGRRSISFQEGGHKWRERRS